MPTYSSHSSFHRGDYGSTVNSNKLHKIIVGVDYGTTFTGVSYVDSTKKSIEDINVIRTWPGPVREADETWKTPSRIAYGSENPSYDGNGIKWGYMVTPRMKSYTWTKLLLDPKRQAYGPADDDLDIIEGNGLMRIPDFKLRAREVCSDYLKEIYRYTLSILEQRFTPELMRVTALEFWFTVPAIWSDKAKNETHIAASLAGFGTRAGDSISMIPEPEAAAVATLSSLAKDEHGTELKVGDGILVCDCGGGTVDIVTYRIIQVKPELRFEELLVGTGDKCGSTYIDREFHKWMLQTFGRAFEKVKFEKKGPGSRFMKDFEAHKRDFAVNSSDQKFEVELVMNAPDAEHYDSDNSMVIFKKAEMESFFKPVTAKIEDLLNDQLKQLGDDARSIIKKIVLVGGFGDSRYLETVLRSWCLRRGGITLLCPENPQASVVKGAALRGLIGTKPEKRKCRLHYGFQLHLPFRNSIDPESHAWIWEWDGSKRCKNRMRWLVEKGKAITKETRIPYELCRVYYPSSSLSYSVDLYTCEDDVAPQWLQPQTCVQVGTLHYSLSEHQLSRFKTKKDDAGKKMYLLEYNIQVEMFADKGLLQFRMMGTDGTEIGKTNIEYR